MVNNSGGGGATKKREKDAVNEDDEMERKRTGNNYPHQKTRSLTGRRTHSAYWLFHHLSLSPISWILFVWRYKASGWPDSGQRDLFPSIFVVFSPIERVSGLTQIYAEDPDCKLLKPSLPCGIVYIKITAASRRLYQIFVRGFCMEFGLGRFDFAEDGDGSEDVDEIKMYMGDVE